MVEVNGRVAAMRERERERGERVKLSKRGGWEWLERRRFWCL